MKTFSIRLVFRWCKNTIKKTNKPHSPYLLVRNMCRKEATRGTSIFYYSNKAVRWGKTWCPTWITLLHNKKLAPKVPIFIFFFWNHPHTRKLLWIKACAGFLIGTRAKENCSVTVNRQISWLRRLNKVVSWPWISSPRMQGALLVSQWEAVAGKCKRSAGLGCFAIYFLIGTTKAIDFGPDCRQKLVISHAGSRRGGVVAHPPARQKTTASFFI